jgi:hypothetical protein
MKLERGYQISAASTDHKRVFVTGSKDIADRFTATVIVPPGCKYQLTEVSDVMERIDMPGWTTIETADAVLEIGNGEYVIGHDFPRTGWPSRILVGSRGLIWSYRSRSKRTSP